MAPLIQLLGRFLFSNRMQGSRFNDISFGAPFKQLAAGLNARLERWSGRNHGTYAYTRVISSSNRNGAADS
jgi:hypothetical protein